MRGKPTSMVGGTSVASPRLGYRMAGGDVSLLIQPSSATNRDRAGGPALSGLVGKGKRIAVRVRHHQRSALLIELDLAVGLDDLRAIVCDEAVRQKAVSLS